MNLRAKIQTATRQLNLHFASRKEDDSCRKSQECAGHPETQPHIFWDCPSAMACWDKLFAGANRQAPSISKHRRNQLDGQFQDDTEAVTKEWKRI
ncbi:hypothetical protein GQ600_9030 [Phytophthora cactorum]|nr:hypothetical protein GQ600_9030 [Phytophthora cactorum]